MRVFRIVGIIVILSVCFTMAGFAQASAPPSSKMSGVFEAKDRNFLRPAFVNGVNHYLRRYSPELISQNDNSVKMTAKYNYLLNIELIIGRNEYEVVVSVAQDKYNSKKAQTICVKIAGGVYRSFINTLARDTKSP